MGWEEIERKDVMTNPSGICPIWGISCKLSESYQDKEAFLVENSYRSGGNYKITYEARREIRDRDLDDGEKARLTSILVEQWMKGIDVPRLTVDDVRRAQENRRLPAHERADRLLRFLANSSPHIGDVLDIVTESSITRRSLIGIDTSGSNSSLYESALAWSESISELELDFSE